MAQAREVRGGSSVSVASSVASSSCNIGIIPRNIEQPEGGSTNARKEVTAGVASVVNRYGNLVKRNTSLSSNSPSSESTSVARNMQNNGTGNKSVQNSACRKTTTSAMASSLPTTARSSSTEGSVTTSNMLTADERNVLETELCRKFEEAFNMTLANNPEILPGAPSVVESIKHVMCKVQQTKVQKEHDMRKQCEKAKTELNHLEAQLRKDMGNTALRRTELIAELETAKSETLRMEESFAKQTQTISATKRKLAAKMQSATAEQTAMEKEFARLQESRAKVEKTLETEIALAEKDRNALEKTVANRVGLQKQHVDNQKLEAEIERMSESAAKENRGLQAEASALRKFQAELGALRQQHQKSRAALEEERRLLMVGVEKMRSEKAALVDSIAEQEKGCQAEIDQLKKQIQERELMHQQETERQANSRVDEGGSMAFGGDLCGGNIEVVDCTNVVDGGVGRTNNAACCTDSCEGFCVDIPSLAHPKIEAELHSPLMKETTQNLMQDERYRLNKTREQENVKEDESKHCIEEKQKKRNQKKQSSLPPLSYWSDDNSSLIDSDDSKKRSKNKKGRRKKKTKNQPKRKKEISREEGNSRHPNADEMVDEMMKEIESLREAIKLVKSRQDDVAAREDNEALTFREEIRLRLEEDERNTARTHTLLCDSGRRLLLPHSSSIFREQAAAAEAAEDEALVQELRCLRDELRESKAAAAMAAAAVALPPPPPQAPPPVAPLPSQSLVMVDNGRTQEEIKDIRRETQCLYDDINTETNNHGSNSSRYSTTSNSLASARDLRPAVGHNVAPLEDEGRTRQSVKYIRNNIKYLREANKIETNGNSRDRHNHRNTTFGGPSTSNVPVTATDARYSMGHCVTAPEVEQRKIKSLNHNCDVEHEGIFREQHQHQQHHDDVIVGGCRSHRHPSEPHLCRRSPQINREFSGKKIRRPLSHHKTPIEKRLSSKEQASHNTRILGPPDEETMRPLSRPLLENSLSLQRERKNGHTHFLEPLQKELRRPRSHSPVKRPSQREQLSPLQSIKHLRDHSHFLSTGATKRRRPAMRSYSLEAEDHDLWAIRKRTPRIRTKQCSNIFASSHSSYNKNIPSREYENSVGDINHRSISYTHPSHRTDRTGSRVVSRVFSNDDVNYDDAVLSTSPPLSRLETRTRVTDSTLRSIRNFRGGQSGYF